MFIKRICIIGLRTWGSINLRSDFCTNLDNLKSLCKILNINESKGRFLQLKYPAIKKMDNDKIKDLTQALYDLGFSNNVLLKEPQLFSILPITLKFRYAVLEECGIDKISTKELVSYLKLIRHQTIGQLKKTGLISQSLNVENKLASNMTQWPTSLTTLVQGDAHNYTLYLLRLKIMQRYLELMLDLTHDEFERGLQTYPTIKHRPLKAVNEMLLLLQNEVMMPNDKIKSNFYLLHANPENLKQILYNIKSIGRMNIKEIIRMHPKIALRNYNSIMETRQILKEYGVSQEAQIRCFQLFTLSPATVRERLENVREIPELNTFYNHPRFLKIIHYKNTALKRIMELYKKDKKCLSLNILSGSSAHFDVFEKAPGDRLGKGKDLVFCISQALGKGYSTSCIRNAIKRHPFWINIPLVQVKYVYDQLSADFTSNDIYENCPILLYPWAKIRDLLNLVNSPNHSSLSVYENIDFKKVTQSQKLSLILYLLEKNHYFTGNGVWTEEQQRHVDLNSYKESNIVIVQ